MGSYGETAMEVVDALRKEGEKVGVVKIRLWRPFPFDEFRKAVLGKKHLIVLDRAISFRRTQAARWHQSCSSALYKMERGSYDSELM
ncbi:MAG: hypothetical protein MZU79_00120 [Anaerotruncus sp.]|nr:hypothetical protein [Anaerotruncus sp.]